MELTKKELLAQKITAAVTEDQEFFKAFIKVATNTYASIERL